MKYKIHNIEFSNKEEITLKCREIIKNNSTNIINGDDLDFLLKLFEYHPNKDTKLQNFKEIFVDVDKMGKNNCFFIRYQNDRIDDISFVKCIQYIPFSEDLHIECLMPFGKYKGISIYEIFETDKQYLEWAKDNLSDRGLKTKIHQLLKYGYVPYNPIAAKKEKYMKHR